MEKIVRKGEIVCNKQLLLFSQCFLPYMVLISHFQMHFKMSSAVCFNLDLSKTLSFGNELNMFWFNDNADDDLATTSILYLSVYCKTTTQKCCQLVTK